MAEYTHLHVHSEYSLLDGMSRIPRLVARTKELGMNSIALTDHGVMYGTIEFYGEAKAQGVKPIIGVETYVAPRRREDKDGRQDGASSHLTLLAMNRAGYRNLIKLTTEAHLSGYYYRPRIDKELLAKHCDGLIALSGCPSGEIPHAVRTGEVEAARKAADFYRQLFPGRFYLEIQEHAIPEMAGLTAGMVQLGKEMGLPLVATNDTHYVESDDGDYQDILLCIQTNTTIDDPKRFHMEGAGYHLRSPQEMAALFGELPEALRNTQVIADACHLQLDFSRLHLPTVVVPAGADTDQFLADRCWAALPRLYDQPAQAARERLTYELDVIRETGFSLYMLIVADFVDYARRQRIMFGIRGSAAASIVCYCLGITEIDPLQWNLAFERFLNRERKSMPDIDMDFADDRRQEMIEYVANRYGRDKVAQIITFGTLGAKAAIRDVGRVLGYPINEVDRIAKMVPSLPLHITIDKAMEDNPALRDAYTGSEAVRALVDKARRLEGIARHASTHAAGVVMSKEPLTEHVPLQKVAKMDGRGAEESVMTQYPMGALEQIGLLKMDFLGLANLTILGQAVSIIRRTRGIDVDVQHIPLDDKKTFDMLAQGETTSVFQFEGSGMRRYIKELKPTTIADLSAMVALYRPGPMNEIPKYIKAKHGEMEVRYMHPALQPILEPTYGVIVYQDQVLFIARAVAGYSLGAADILRRAMGKKKKEDMAREEEHFIKGAVQNGFGADLAKAIFDLIQPFAGYAFNAAHAACYAMVAYQTAYLKANFPVEYMCAVLQSAMGNMDKVAIAAAEARRLGIAIRPPDINTSDLTFTVQFVGEEAVIRVGLAAIKNVGEGPVRDMIAMREQGGQFSNIDDFGARIDLKAANRRVLESLIKAGALDGLARRSQLLSVLDRLVGVAGSQQRAQEAGQASLFDAMSESERPRFIVLPPMEEADDHEKLAWEKELLGFYVSEHPLQKVARVLQNTVTALCGQIDEDMANQKVVVAGMISNLRRITTKKGDPMLFATLEDVEGSIEVTVFPRVYQETEGLWEMDTIVVVHGKVDVRDEKTSIICNSVQPYSLDQVAEPGASPEDMPDDGYEPPPPPSVRVMPGTGNGKSSARAAAPARQTSERKKNGGAPASGRRHLRIQVPYTDADSGLLRLQALDEALARFPGNDRVSLCLKSGLGTVRMSANRTTLWSEGLSRELTEILGQGMVEVETI